MAIGEAFINVRADVKPFARDLEKGLRAILKEAEAKIGRDPSLGKAFGKKISEGVSGGVEDGLTKGSKRGAKKGTQEALGTFQKFFSALGDFADDGLSAIPTDVKAALVVGIVGAATVFAPILGGAVEGAIAGGVASGFAIIGTVLAFRLRSVQKEFSDLGDILLGELTNSAQKAFEGPLLNAAVKILDGFHAVREEIDQIFSNSADVIEPLATALLGLVKNALPGIIELTRNLGPVTQALGTALPELGYAISNAFKILASTGEDGANALKDMVRIIGILVVDIAALIGVLTTLYGIIRPVIKGISDLTGFSNTFHQAASAIGGDIHSFSQGLDNELNPSLSDTATEAAAAKSAISDLVDAFLDAPRASLKFNEALTDLQKSIKNGNKNFKETNEKGQQNLELVYRIIAAAAAQRDADIKTAIQNGESTDKIEANYQRQIDVIEQTISKTGGETAALQTLFDKARSAPKEVAINVHAPGLSNTIGLFGTLKRRATEVATDIFNLIKKNNKNPSYTPSGGGKHFALGGIVSSPTNAVIGEAGYKEGVIPDPSVMPGRAMELSNQLGLTSLIAKSLGAGTPIVNVYLGTERLDARVDTRIAYNNQLQATSMSYGPRK